MGWGIWSRVGEGCEAGQDQLDDALGEVLVDRTAGDQQPVEEGAAEHIKRELEVEAATKIPPSHTALEDHAQRRAPTGQKLISDGAREFGVAARLLKHRGHQPGRQRTVVELDGLAHQCQQISASGPGIGDRDLADQRRDRVADQRILGAIATVDRGLPDTRSVSDVIHPKVTDPALGHQMQRRREDRAIRSRLPRPARSPAQVKDRSTSHSTSQSRQSVVITALTGAVNEP